MKKIFTLFSAALMAGTMFAQTSWVDAAADSYAGGSGTYDDPYLIETPEQLAKIAKDCDAGDNFFDEDNFDCVYFKQTSNIDLDGKEWEPIGGYLNQGGSAAFEGYFDGNGFVIENINVNKSVPFQSGLFNNVGDYGELHNVVLESGSVTAEAGVGGVTAYLTGRMYNCVNKASITALASTEFSGGGAGVCGTINPTKTGEPAAVIGCINYGNVKIGNNNGFTGGGVIAYVKGPCNISQCANYGTILAPTAIAGGIVSYATSGCIIRDCYNRGKISSSTQIGGIVGQAYNDTETYIFVYNCYNAAPITGDDGETKPNGLDNSIFGANSGLRISVVDSVYNNIELNIPGFVDDIIPGSMQIEYNESYPEWIKDEYLPNGQYLKNFTTEEMANNQEFVDLLNSSSNGTWVMDTKNINEGYPVFYFQNPDPGSSISTINEDDFAVYSVNSRIIVNKSKGEVAVYDLTGNMLFSGNVESVKDKTFNEGLYLVSVNGKGYKVQVK